MSEDWSRAAQGYFSKNFDRAPVTTRATRINPLDGSSRIVEYDFDSQTAALLQEIVEFYSRMRAGDLTRLSHVVGGPWDQVWNHAATVKPGMKIEDVQIASFYSHCPCWRNSPTRNSLPRAHRKHLARNWRDNSIRVNSR